MSYIKVGCTIQVFEMKSDRVLTPKEGRRFKTHSRVIQWPSLKSVERLFCRLNLFPKKHSPKKLPLIVSSCLPTSDTCVNKLSLPFDDMVPPTYCVVPENIHTPPTDGLSDYTPPPPQNFRSRGVMYNPPTPQEFPIFLFMALHCRI